MDEFLLVSDQRGGRARGDRAQSRGKLLLERLSKKEGTELADTALEHLGKFASDSLTDLRGIAEKSGKAMVSVLPGRSNQGDTILSGAKKALGLAPTTSMMMTLQNDMDGKSIVVGLYVMKDEKKATPGGERAGDPILNSTSVAGFAVPHTAEKVEANTLKNPHLFVAIQPLKEQGSSLVKPNSALQGVINMYGFQDWSEQAIPPVKAKKR